MIFYKVKWKNIYSTLLYFYSSIFEKYTRKTKGGESIRKQVILLSTTIVFALLLCGAVSAADPQVVKDKEDIKINYTTIYSGGTHHQLMMESVKEYPNVNYTTHLTTPSLPSNLNFTNQNLVVLDLYMDSYVPVVEGAVNEAKKNNATVIILSPLTNTSQKLSTVNLTQHPYITQYFDNGGLENEKRLLQYIMINFFGLNETVRPPVTIPVTGIYHPDSGVPFANVTDYLQWYQSDGTHHKYDPDKPTVGIVFQRDSYTKSSTSWVDSLIHKLEAQGINCVAEFGMLGDSLTIIMNTTNLKTNLPIDLLISAKSYRLRSYSNESLEKGVDYLNALNVPVINAVIGLYQISPEMWINSTDGIPASSIGTRLALPEMDGTTEFIVIAGEVKLPGTEIYVTVPIPEQVDWLVSRTAAWINLRRESNSTKNIAVIYYHHTSGKDSVGVMNEGGLNTYESLVNFLKALKNSGYNTGPIPTVDQLQAQMKLYGRNVGVWAPGELETMVNTGKVGLIPLNQYMQWFNQLPQANREAVIDMWGEPPGDIMVYEKNGAKYIVIPYVKYGNILLAPQPMRGKDQNATVLFTDDAVPPTHQYIAFYMWMNKVFDADALIHFGTYGSFEYLPGKQTGLSVKTDWPAILIQDMPHIYLYTIDGAAGATQAKRRANALLIGYSTPAIIAAELYGDLANLENELALYDQAADETVKKNQREKILKDCKTLNLGKDLGVDLSKVTTEEAFDKFKITLRDYLTRLKNEYMPYGLHTLGESITGTYLISMVNSMLGNEFKQYLKDKSITENQTTKLLSEVIFNGKTAEQAQNSVLGKIDAKLTNFLNLALVHAQNVQSCDQEITSLLNALEGKYVLPGPGGDPIRKPDALPSGRNLYSFDPREIPIKTSRDLGVQMAEDLVQKYLKETGEYPRKVSVFLWATETMKHLGVMESEILRLLGVKVEYDSYNRPTKLSLIPSEELGRPRIDVLIVASGIYRDTFPIQMALLDQAIQMAAQANDTTYPNYVKENSQAIYDWLISQGYNSTTAKELSMTRIFSAAPGGYGPSTSSLIHQSNQWDDESDIGNLFTNGWGYAYSQTAWGSQFQDIFSKNLAGVDMVTHSISSNNYGLLYGDGYFSDLGGLILAVRTASGKNPAVYLNNLRDSNNAKVESLDQFLSMEFRTRNANPEWIKGMMGQNSYGASIMSTGVENLFGWTVTNPDSVPEWMWDEVMDVYVNDKYNLGMKEFFDTNNPNAKQSMIATMVDAIRKGYWNPSTEVKTQLANEYIESVIKYGVTCCHHTCANMDLSEFMVTGSSLSQAQLQQFADAFEGATGKTIEVPGTPGEQTEPNPGTVTPGTDVPGGEDREQNTNPNQGTISPGETSTVQAATTEAGQTSDSNSQSAHEISQVNEQNSSQSNTPLVAIIGVILLMCLVGIGYFRNDIMERIRK